MKISQLKQIATLQKKHTISDGIGGFTIIWQDVNKIWVNISTVNKLKFKKNICTHKIMMRENHELSFENRLKICGKAYQIKSIKRHKAIKGYCSIDASVEAL